MDLRQKTKKIKLKKSDNGKRFFTIDKLADYAKTTSQKIIEAFCNKAIPWPPHIAKVGGINRIVWLDTKALKEAVNHYFGVNISRGGL